MLKPNQESQCINVCAFQTHVSWAERKLERTSIKCVCLGIVSSGIKGRKPGAFSKALEQRSESSHLSHLGGT